MAAAIQKLSSTTAPARIPARATFIPGAFRLRSSETARNDASSASVRVRTKVRYRMVTPSRQQTKASSRAIRFWRRLVASTRPINPHSIPAEAAPPGASVSPGGRTIARPPAPS